MPPEMVRVPWPPGPRPWNDWVLSSCLKRSRISTGVWGAREGAGLGSRGWRGPSFSQKTTANSIAADAGDEVVVAAAASHQAGGLLEDLIADAVAELVRCSA